MFRELSRDDAIAAARGIAEDRTVRAGAARASLKTVDVEDMPIACLPGNDLRVRVRVAGRWPIRKCQRGVAAPSVSPLPWYSTHGRAKPAPARPSSAPLQILRAPR